MKPNWGGAIVLGIAAILLATLLLVVFVVNPTAQSNRVELVNQAKQEKRTQAKLYAFICAQAQSTANAFRFKQASPRGIVESTRHFLTRMLAQQQTLRLSSHLHCPSIEGFPSFETQLKRGLRQIHEILQRFSPKLKEPIAHALEMPGETSFEAPVFSPPMPTRHVRKRRPPQHLPTQHEALHPKHVAKPPPPFEVPSEVVPPTPPAEEEPPPYCHVVSHCVNGEKIHGNPNPGTPPGHQEERPRH